MAPATALKTFAPSPFQQAIFDALAEATSHIQINAVAGSGKTTTLVEALNRLPGALRASTLMCAFNKEIARELASRVPCEVTVKTNHAIGYGTLAGHFSGQGPKWNPTVDEWKYRKLIRLYWTQFYRDERDPETEAERHLLKLCHFVRVTLTDPTNRDAVLALAADHEIELPESTEDLVLVLNALPTVLKWGSRGRDIPDRDGLRYSPQEVIDFDDMLWLPWVLNLRPRRFRRVMVDECQDLNAAQLWLVLNSLTQDGRLIAVGDPRQAIYAFTGADSQAFRRIAEATKARELPLSVCYRCPTSVVELAAEIVPDLLPAPDAERGSVDTIHEGTFTQMVDNRDMVLCRVNAPLIGMAFRLIGQGRPAKVRGRDIGASVVKTLDQIEKLEGFRFDQFLTFVEKWAAINMVLAQQKKSETLAQSARDRADCAEAIYMGAVNEGARTVGDLRAWVERIFTDTENGHILLSSIHKAKGLEADRVFILRPDKLPHPMAKSPAAIEQEENLRYVAYTRAMRQLFIVSPDPEAK
jgi:DNA helicase-2/ATP-dependent DNA helicase PcrA